jgi:hypothetical protein
MEDLEIEFDENGKPWTYLASGQKITYNVDKDTYYLEVKSNDGTVTKAIIPSYVLDILHNSYWDNLKTIS